LDIARSAIEAAAPAPVDKLFVVSRAGWLNVPNDLAPPCDFPVPARAAR
jgi:hypothetical protein